MILPRWRSVLRMALPVAASVVMIAPAMGLLPILAWNNTTPSVAVGWWHYSGGDWWFYRGHWPPERGDVVGMKDPPFWKLPILFKRVEGVAGDRFCWHDGRHWINDRPMQPMPPLAYEMEKKIPGFTIWRGCEVLKPGQIAGFGAGSTSYGSGYFGPVGIDRLWGIYTPGPNINPVAQFALMGALFAAMFYFVGKDIWRLVRWVRQRLARMVLVDLLPLVLGLFVLAVGLWLLS